MLRSRHLIVGIVALALSACGGDTAKSNTTDNSNTANDMGGVGDSGPNNQSNDPNNESNDPNNGTDMGGGGDDMGGGGDDMGGGGDDMAGDMGGDDMGDMGPDPRLCGNAMLDPFEECDDANDDDTDECNSDCTFTCGDGVVGPAEACDIAIPAGDAGSCPTACDDGNACTSDTLQGAECQAECVTGAIMACVDGDGCCPMNTICCVTNDNDCTNMCTSVCGNNMVEMGEMCDDGNTTNGDGCDSMCQVEGNGVAFRMSDLDLMDPHVYLNFLGCRDITNGNVPLGLSPPINGLLQNAITLDEDNDGILDLSFVAIFNPLDQTNGGMGQVTVAEADCTAPIGTTTCTVDSNGGTFQTATYATDTMNDCLDAIMNTASNYTPAIDASVPPCFVSTTIDLTIDISGILVPLTDVQVGASYVGNPATALASGLLRGFISEADADAILLPSSLPLIGGDPLSSVLAGGNGSCASGDDRDLGPDGMTMGWWFYLNFPADQVQVTIN